MVTCHGFFVYPCITNKRQINAATKKSFGLVSKQQKGFLLSTDGEIYLEEKNCGFVNASLKNGYSEAITYQSEEGYYSELMNFYKALENNETIVCDPEKELGDIQLVFDILKSIETDKAIEASNHYQKKKVRKFL